MYKYGVAHCCCGCVIYNFDNCKTEAQFNRAFTHISGSEPVFSGTAGNYIGERATFSSNAKYSVNSKNLKEHIGIHIIPNGAIDSVSYSFVAFSSSDTQQRTWKVVFEKNTGTTSGSKPYKASVYRWGAKLFETVDLPCEGFANEIPDDYLGTFNFKAFLIKDTYSRKIQFWAQFADGSYYFLCDDIAGRASYFKLEWEVAGTNWYLEPDSPDGYINLWEPKKGNSECEYPDDCSYLIGNINQVLPQIKVWFTGFQDHAFSGGTGIWDCGRIPPDALSLLNGLECYGRSKQRCTIRFNATRWVIGALETNPDYDSSKLDDSTATEKDVCQQRLSAAPVLLLPEYLRFSQSQTYDDRVDLTLGVFIYRYESRNPEIYSYGSNAYSATFRGTAYKNSAGQIDLTRLNEVVLTPGTADTGHPDWEISGFTNVIGHIALSSHTDANNKAILATEQTANTGEIDYITLTCEIGFIGFTDNTRTPTGYNDFVQYYQTVTAVLTPQNQSWVNDPSCNLPPLVWKSPTVSLTGEYSNLYFKVYLHTGEIKVYFNSIFESNFTQGGVPGSSVVSPRGAGNLTFRNCTPIANDTYYIQGLGADEAGIPQTAGQFLNNIDNYGNMTIMCIHPYYPDGSSSWQMVMGIGFAGRAYIPDAYCSPQTDPDTFDPIYYWGGIPCMKGTIAITYKQ